MSNKIEILPLYMNALLHFFILFIILNLLFWVVITKVSKDAIYNEVTGNIKTPLRTVLNKLSNDQRAMVASLPYEELKIMYKDANSIVKTNNCWLKKYSVNLIIIFAIILCLFIIYYNKNKTYEMPTFLHILSENIGIFIFVALIEIIFFLVIAIKYVPSLPSHIIKSSKDIIVNILEEQSRKNKDIKNSISASDIIKAQDTLSIILNNPTNILKQ